MVTANDEEREREKERQQRDFELLKHISTLNVATIVLLLTIARDFSPKAPTTLPLGTVLLFYASLLCAMIALVLHIILGRVGAKRVRTLTAVSLVLFAFGLGFFGLPYLLPLI
jgi:hypothetical protein